MRVITDDLPSRKFAARIYAVGAWTAHLHFAYDLVALMRPAVLVELGVDRGESYFAFCQSVAENQTGTRCFGVDTWRGDAQAGQYDETTFAQVTEHNRAHYENFSKLLRCTFDEAVPQFSDGAIDVLHLDGLHSEEAVRHDLRNWLPKLRPGGVLLMHDVAVRNRGFGVWKVWAELQRTGRSWTFEDGPGLGVWQKPPNESLPAVLETLFSGEATDRESILHFYRARHRETEDKARREWRDGSVRHLPFLQQTVIQVFHTHDGIHREENSVNARIGHDAWKEVSIPLPEGAGVNPLRIDFVSPLTTIEIASVQLRNDGENIFHATNTTDFEKIRLGGDVALLPAADHLLLKITGIDPQLYLPAFPTQTENRHLFLEMRLRVVTS